MGIGTRHFTRVISPVIASHDQDIPLHCVKDNTAKTTATIPKWSLDIVNPNKCSRACSDFLKLGCFRFPIRGYFHNRMYPENNVGIEMSNPILIHYRHRAVFIQAFVIYHILIIYSFIIYVFIYYLNKLINLFVCLFIYLFIWLYLPTRIFSFTCKFYFNQIIV